jgi:hypothetical protein
MMRSIKNRRGMAIVVALAFAFCLLLMILGMWVSQRNVATQNRLFHQQQQAFFAARSAMQHFLVKSRLTPTELYDAVSFTQGKNPFFGFNQYSQGTGNDPTFFQADDDGTYIQGPSGAPFKLFCLKKKDYSNNWILAEADKSGVPRSVYMALDNDSNPQVLIKLGSYHNPMFRFLHSSLVKANAADRTRYVEADPNVLKTYNDRRFKYLDFYLRDCTNATYSVFPGQVLPSGNKVQPLLEVQKASSVTPKNWKLEDYSLGDFTNNNRYPYTMLYRVASVSIAAMKELRKYGEEAIQIEVEGMIIDFQGKVFKSRQSKTQKITRKGYQ